MQESDKSESTTKKSELHDNLINNLNNISKNSTAEYVNVNNNKNNGNVTIQSSSNTDANQVNNVIIKDKN